MLRKHKTFWGTRSFPLHTPRIVTLAEPTLWRRNFFLLGILSIIWLWFVSERDELFAVGFCLRARRPQTILRPNAKNHLLGVLHWWWALNLVLSQASGNCDCVWHVINFWTIIVITELSFSYAWAAQSVVFPLAIGPSYRMRLHNHHSLIAEMHNCRYYKVGSFYSTICPHCCVCHRPKNKTKPIQNVAV